MSTSKPTIAIKLNPKDKYSDLVNLGNRVVTNLTGNLNFTTVIPALTVLTANITDVVNAIAAWGPRSNRGSHADLVTLRAAALTLSQTLKSVSQYVMNTAQTAAGSDYTSMAAIITTSGFQLKAAKTPQGVLEMVQGFHNFISRQLNPNQVKLKWKKPLNVSSAGNVKSYNIYRGATTVFSAAMQIATTTKTSFIDSNSTSAPIVYNYWVVPVNTSGEGVTSDVVSVTVANA